MSAFLVTYETINRTLYAMHRVYSDRYPLNTERANDLARKLLAMNQRSLSERYGDDESDTFADFDWSPSAYTIMQEYKALICFLYQCDEGIVPDSALFKECDEVADCLARRIVSDLPAYDHEVWDAPDRKQLHKQIA